MLQYAAKLQDDTGLHFPLQGGDVFRKLCGIYAEFRVFPSSYHREAQFRTA